MKYDIQQLQSSSILTKSNLPDTDYVINPYVGCQFACSYCYATFMTRNVGRHRSEWGKFIYVKNFDETKLLKQLSKLSADKKILLSSVTDPYTFAENRLKRTRRILELIRDSEFRGSVGILTKSPTILRDLDLISSIKGAEVGMTIPVIDDLNMRLLEPFAPSAKARVSALEKIRQRCEVVYAFLSPLMPYHVLQKDLVLQTLRRMQELSPNYIYAELLNLRKDIRDTMLPFIAKLPQNLQRSFFDSPKQNLKNLQTFVNEELDKLNLSPRLGGAMDHSING